MLSVCLIVKNEERLIEKCLQQFVGVADEIIIGDTGSTDKTKEIISRYRVKLFDITWNRDFSEARNLTIEKATQPWIFSFDADEMMPSEEWARLRDALFKIDSDQSIEALKLVRRNLITNPSIGGFIQTTGQYKEAERGFPGYYNEGMVRVFRRAPHLRWQNKIHENMEPALRGNILATDISFYHYGYLPEESERKDRVNTYTDLGRSQMEQRPDDWKVHYDIACEYLVAGKFHESIPYFDRSMELIESTPDMRLEWRIMMMNNFGYALMQASQHERARDVINKGLAQDPINHDLLLNRCVLAMRQKEQTDAMRYFKDLLKSHPNSFQAYRNLGLFLSNIRRFEEAKNAFEMAIKIFPNYIDAKLDLATLLFMQSHFEASANLAKECEPHPRAAQITHAINSKRR